MKNDIRRVISGDLTLPSRSRRLGKYLHERARMILGVIGFCLVAGPVLAQDPPVQDPAVRVRLTVRPSEMATASRTTQAGIHELDSTTMYVPPACVGSKRCPLVVALFNASSAVRWLREGADKYGIIVLEPRYRGRQRWKQVFERNADEPAAGVIDRALKQVLSKFAIDPDKIAIIGRCGGGKIASLLGFDNVDVFSRVAVISGGVAEPRQDPRNATIDFFYSGGLGEGGGGGFSTWVSKFRQAGHPVTYRIALRGHEHQQEDYLFFMRWLHDSWATPSPANRPAPPPGVDPMPRLTPEALAQMADFWTRFTQRRGTTGKPYRASPGVDSALMAARRAHLRELTVPVGEGQPEKRPSVVLVDMEALAADVPAVADALEKSDLTPQRHDAYRIALISAMVGEDARDRGGLVVEPTSTLGKNIAFLAAHSEARKALSDTGIWRLP